MNQPSLTYCDNLFDINTNHNNEAEEYKEGKNLFQIDEVQQEESTIEYQEESPMGLE